MWLSFSSAAFFVLIIFSCSVWLSDKRVCVVVTWGAPQENHSHKWACLHPLRESWWDVNCPDDDASWTHKHWDTEPLWRLPVQTEILTLQSNLCICYVGLHPSRLSRAGLHRGSHATGTAWGGGGGEACCHEKRATTCYLCSSSPATDFKSQQICRDKKKKCTFTIHTADRFGVRFRRATLHWVVHARKAKHLCAHFPGISHAIILVWRKVKNIKSESCGGMCCRETLLCHYHAWQLFRGEAFFFNAKKNFD